MKKYIIVASCDPYNARKHYNGEEVKKKDGTTPVEWVQDDNHGDGFDLEDAKKALWDLAMKAMWENCDWSHEDDDSIAETKRQFLEDEGESLELAWYKGEGIYENEYPVILKGETSFRDDTMYYSIEEA